MLVLVGKTCSGKDSVVNKLISEHNFKKIITYTTRPKRKGEKNGITYHYISEEDFLQKINEGFFAEWKSYDTEFGIWYYGSSIEDYEKADDNTVIILTPDGFRDVINKLTKKPAIIYIYANNPTIKKRLLARGDNKSEAERRLIHDNDDFKGVENEVDKLVFNNEGTQLEYVVNKILELMEEID